MAAEKFKDEYYVEDGITHHLEFIKFDDGISNGVSKEYIQINESWVKDGVSWTSYKVPHCRWISVYTDGIIHYDGPYVD